MVLATYRSTGYNIALFLHILSVLVAFAPTVVNPLTVDALRGNDSFGRFLGISASNGRRVYFPALVIAGLLGIVLVVLAGDVVGFGEFWVSAAFLMWIAIAGVVSGMILPNERRLASGYFPAEKQVELGGQITAVLFLGMLYLMVFKPGAHLL